MDPDSGAGLLHRLSSYSPGDDYDDPQPVSDPRLLQGRLWRDLDALPPAQKLYPSSLPTLALPRDLPDAGVPATAALAGAPVAARTLDAAELGRVLFRGAGVVRTTTSRGRPFLFRASGSAGGRFPLEVYVSTHGVDGVPDGVHWYDGVAHALVQVAPPADGEATTVVVTGVPWRTGWKYAERGWRHLYWDAGTLLSHLQAAAHGLTPRLRTLFPDAAVADLVGADGVHEYPLALLTFGDGAPAIGSTGPAATGELPQVEMPLATAAQRAGDADVLGAPWPDGDPLDDVPPSDSLDLVVQRKGSQRRMDRSATIPRALVDWPMRAALRGIDVPHWVAAHAVETVEPGIYRWPDLTGPVRTGDLRDEVAHVCMDQFLGAEAAYVAMAAIPASQLDDRGYRDAQLAAGLVEGRLHLAAYALGISATGMTFTDAEVPGLLGEPDDLVTLLFTCVGVPEYAAVAGGTPGAPVAFRQVASRMA